MGRIYDPDDFVVQYPGKYEGAAKAAMERYFADIRHINETEVTGAELTAGRVKAPKLGDTLHVSGNMMRYCTAKYAPGFAPMLESDTARAYGFGDIYAMPGFGSCDDVYTIPTPAEARDTLLVSQLCHEIRNLRPVHPGDTLYMVRDHMAVKDLTPEEGSIYRHLYQICSGTVYNQKGEAVNKVCYSTMESLKVYKEGHSPKPKEKMGFADMWEDPDWFARPEHVYTDEDYANIKRVWAAEPVRGRDTLKWEEVQVGDRFPDGIWGPIFDGVAPTKPYGMGVGGCRSLKAELLGAAENMLRDERTGIWKSAEPTVNVPEVPDGVKPFWLAPPDEVVPAGEVSTTDIHKTANTRSALINFMGRDIAMGYVLGCIGFGGRIRCVRWSIMSPETHAALGKPVPAADHFRIFSRQAPEMARARISAHGLTNDIARIKTYVADKYVENEEHIVKVVFWNTDIEGNDWISGEMEVVLPSKKA